MKLLLQGSRPDQSDHHLWEGGGGRIFFTAAADSTVKRSLYKHELVPAAIRTPCNLCTVNISLIQCNSELKTKISFKRLNRLLNLSIYQPFLLTAANNSLYT